MIKAAVLSFLLIFGQWVALAHACEITASPAGANKPAALLDHQLPEHGEIFCMATAVAGDELADAVLTPLVSKLDHVGHALTPAPPAVLTRRIFVSHSSRAIGLRPPLTLFGRLRI